MAAVGIMAYPGRETYNGYPQQYAMYPARALQTQAEVAINANPYGTYTSPSQPQHQQQPQQQQQQHTQQQQHVTRSPQPSGSPVSDDGFKPSLPSISNLLGIADRPTRDLASQHAQTSTQLLEQAQQRQSSPQQYHAEARARVSYHAQDQSTSPRTVVHPSAPLRTDSVLEGTQSPSAISNASMSGPPYFVGSAINNVEPADQRTTQVQMMKRNSVPSQPNLSPYGGSARYTSSPYANSPGAGSTTSYFSPTEANYPVPHNLYQQRPLPSNFPPQPMAVQQTSHMPTSNPWEHHHYISPSSQATFPQSQDRYICPTCNKAFSRPSSLKIHINSHTGEKPFKCPQPGCGKAFSVRSNMKRHHRGCHTTGVANHMPSHQHSHLMV